MTTTKPKKRVAGRFETAATVKLATNSIACYARLVRTTACFLSKQITIEGVLVLYFLIGMAIGVMV